jgi:hypothetical protein
MCWPILSEQVLSRLIKYPQDEPSVFKIELEAYEKNQAEIDLFRKHNFDVLNIVDLDATLHPDMLFEHLKKRMHIRGYSIYNPVIIPKRLIPIEGGFKSTIINNLQASPKEMCLNITFLWIPQSL